MTDLQAIAAACDLFYLASASLVVSLLILYKPLLQYGKTMQSSQPPASSLYGRIESFVMSQTLPRTTFTHFYIVGITWLVLVKTTVTVLHPGAITITSNLVLGLYACQLVKRAHECITVMRSSGRMHLFHYIAGILFYLVTPITLILPFIQSNEEEEVHHTSLTIKNAFLSGLFLYSWYQQHVNHIYLASLKADKAKTYVFPEAFTVMCPHYTHEIVMYMALVGLSGASWSVLVWLVVDLGISADVQYKWYIQKYGRAVVGNRFRMVSYIY